MMLIMIKKLASNIKNAYFKIVKDDPFNLTPQVPYIKQYYGGMDVM